MIKQLAAIVTGAIRISRLAKEVGLGNLVKLEVIGDPKTLMPDTAGLLEATEVLVREGFLVMPYTNDDVIVAKKLQDAGAVCVMPLAAPIGSGRGIQNRLNLRFIKEAVACPVIVDAADPYCVGFSETFTINPTP